MVSLLNKKYTFFLILTFLFFTQLSFVNHNGDGCCSKKAARCTGSASCRACTSCKSCKWCSSGGSCGVCAPVKTKSPGFKSAYGKGGIVTESNSGKCRAITQKGSRCSRKAGANGYCWQHGE